MRGDGFRSDVLEVQQETLAAYTENEARLNKQISLLDTQRQIASATKIQVLAQQPGWKAIAKEAGEAVDLSTKQYNITANSIDATNDLNKSDTDRKNNLAVQLAYIKSQNVELDRDMKLTQIASSMEQSLVDIQKQELQLELEKGIVTVDAYNQQLYSLEQIQRAKQRDLKLSALQSQYSLDMLGYAKEFSEATTAQIPDIVKRYEATNSVYEKEVDSVNKVFTATERLAEQQKALPQRQQAYAELFTSAFKSMEDAIVEFTRTGKLSFSSMIESFIEGLLRYEIQQQQAMLLQSVGGVRGLAGAAITFGQTLFDTNTAGNTMFDAGMNQLAPNAKGAAYDYGIQAFAKGGMFTNQIVDSPTLFKFARGTGLMGEAGPEAIMPLTRDGSGNLGVRAQGGNSNVEVVVNNYSNAQAETRETTDSRGNRRIEVIVGDMVAQEVSKTGSATQNAFSSTYGTRPALARR
jgi:phage-related minor tail protein